MKAERTNTLYRWLARMDRKAGDNWSLSYSAASIGKRDPYPVVSRQEARLWETRLRWRKVLRWYIKYIGKAALL